MNQKLTIEEFEDFVLLYIMNKLVSGNANSDNMDSFIETIQSKAMKSFFSQLYPNTNSRSRLAASNVAISDSDVRVMT